MESTGFKITKENKKEAKKFLHLLKHKDVDPYISINSYSWTTGAYYGIKKKNTGSLYKKWGTSYKREYTKIVSFEEFKAIFSNTPVDYPIFN